MLPRELDRQLLKGIINGYVKHVSYEVLVELYKLIGYDSADFPTDGYRAKLMAKGTYLKKGTHKVFLAESKDASIDRLLRSQLEQLDASVLDSLPSSLIETIPPNKDYGFRTIPEVAYRG